MSPGGRVLRAGPQALLIHGSSHDQTSCCHPETKPYVGPALWRRGKAAPSCSTPSAAPCYGLGKQRQTHVCGRLHPCGRPGGSCWLQPGAALVTAPSGKGPSRRSALSAPCLRLSKPSVQLDQHSFRKEIRGRVNPHTEESLPETSQQSGAQVRAWPGQPSEPWMDSSSVRSVPRPRGQRCRPQQGTAPGTVSWARCTPDPLSARVPVPATPLPVPLPADTPGTAGDAPSAELPAPASCSPSCSHWAVSHCLQER